MSKVAVKLEAVQFKSHEVQATREGDNVYVLFKPLCEALGLSYSGQFERLKRDEALSPTIRVMRTVGLDGKNREMTFIELDGLALWMGGIDTARIKDEKKRKVLVRYKTEAARVLRNHFFPNAQKTNRSHDTNGSPGPAYHDFTRPRTAPGEVEVYSPPMTIADGVQLMQESFKMFQDKLPDMVATIVNGKGKNSLANQIKRRIRIAVAEETALLKDRVDDLEGHIDDLIDDANDKLDRLKKLTTRMSKLEKIARAAVDQGNMTKNELNNLLGEFTAFRKSMKKVVGPVKKEKPIKKKGRTIN